MTVLTQIFICSSSVNILQNCSFSQKGQTPTSCRCVSGPQVSSFRHRDFKLKDFQQKRRFLEVCKRKDLILVRDGRETRRRSAVLARFSRGFGLSGGGSGGGGGGGGKDDSRVLVNLALAIGLAYLTFSGDLGRIFDTILSIGLVIVLVPIVGLVAFFVWALQDVVESSCPSCGQDFQTFKTLLDDEPQLCPYCAQPFSVIDDKFVKEPVNFKNEFKSKAKSDPRPKTDSSTAIVDIEAEVKDID